MKKNILSFLTWLCALNFPLSAQTLADSIAVVSAEWETTGVSIPELAHLIRVLGGSDALNLDGGGSTTLWMEQTPDNGVLNCPSDNRKFDHQGERSIPNIIYVHKP